MCQHSTHPGIVCTGNSMGVYDCIIIALQGKYIYNVSLIKGYKIEMNELFSFPPSIFVPFLVVSSYFPFTFDSFGINKTLPPPLGKICASTARVPTVGCWVPDLEKCPFEYPLNSICGECTNVP
jgi:hypothetical protein